jgi:hypothetical protein
MSSRAQIDKWRADKQKVCGTGPQTFWGLRWPESKALPSMGRCACLPTNRVYGQSKSHGFSTSSSGHPSVGGNRVLLYPVIA